MLIFQVQKGTPHEGIDISKGVAVPFQLARDARDQQLNQQVKELQSTAKIYSQCAPKALDVEKACKKYDELALEVQVGLGNRGSGVRLPPKEMANLENRRDAALEKAKSVFKENFEAWVKYAIINSSTSYHFIGNMTDYAKIKSIDELKDRLMNDLQSLFPQKPDPKKLLAETQNAKNTLIHISNFQKIISVDYKVEVKDELFASMKKYNSYLGATISSGLGTVKVSPPYIDVEIMMKTRKGFMK